MNPLEVKRELEQQGFALERLKIEGTTVTVYDRDGQPYTPPSTVSPKFITDLLKKGFALTPPQTPGTRLGYSSAGTPKEKLNTEGVAPVNQSTPSKPKRKYTKRR